jgi:hypothetical protein
VTLADVLILIGVGLICIATLAVFILLLELWK